MKGFKKINRPPDKQRILDVIRHIERPDIPMLETDPDISLVEKMLDKKIPYHLHSYEMPAEDNVELNLRMGNDMVSFAHVWRAGRKEKQDAAGRLHYLDGTVKSRQDMEKLWYPDLGELEKRLEMTCRRSEGTGLGVFCTAQSAISTAYAAMGPNDFLLNTIMDPDFLKDLIKYLHEYCMREMQVFLQYPLDMMRVSSRLQSDKGPLISPEMIEEFEIPFLREQINLIKDHQLPVYFHVDGKVDHLIPGFIEMGIDIINPVDPCGGIQDIFKIKEQYGKQISLCGNIDVNTVLKDGTPGQVRENVTYYMQNLGVGGGYIVASSHDLHHLVPIENFYAMRDAVAEFRLNV